MEFSLESLIASFLIGTVGFSLFIYGKKQLRYPQLFAGIALMIEPWVLSETLPMTLGAVGVIAALWLAVHFGW